MNLSDSIAKGLKDEGVRGHLKEIGIDTEERRLYSEHMNRCSYVCEIILIHRRAEKQSRKAEQACRAERSTSAAGCRRIERGKEEMKWQSAM